MLVIVHPWCMNQIVLVIIKIRIKKTIRCSRSKVSASNQIEKWMNKNICNIADKVFCIRFILHIFCEQKKQKSSTVLTILQIKHQIEKKYCIIYGAFDTNNIESLSLTAVVVNGPCGQLIHNKHDETFKPKLFFLV